MKHDVTETTRPFIAIENHDSGKLRASLGFARFKRRGRLIGRRATRRTANSTRFTTCILCHKQQVTFLTLDKCAETCEEERWRELIRRPGTEG
ncbi:hypothetical protein PUN28_017332 [Cardiocondyla obscurior]|uniref:Uncharacterized protein n=1 Tax=Cardiocondyla obscurior TaxID=286306 RepID=A0AAW2ER75_9HYME